MQIVIDTTSQNLLISLLYEFEEVDRVFIDAKNKHSEIALDQLTKLLKKNKLKLKDTTAVYVGVGPGSYTGVRIGLSIANTLLVLNSKIKSYAFNSMLLNNGADKAISFRDARSNKFYMLVSDSMKVKAEKLVDVEDKDKLIKKYKAYKEKKDYDIDNFIENLSMLKTSKLIANYIKPANATKPKK